MATRKFNLPSHLYIAYLYNLIYNSIKYARDGVVPRIHVKSSMVNEYVCLEVRDNGIGIECENMDDVFELFFQSDKRRKGSGMGLHIVKNIAESSGGRAEVNSIPGGGSNFKIYLKEEKVHCEVI